MPETDEFELENNPCGCVWAIVPEDSDVEPESVRPDGTGLIRIHSCDVPYCENE